MIYCILYSHFSTICNKRLYSIHINSSCLTAVPDRTVTSASAICFQYLCLTVIISLCSCAVEDNHLDQHIVSVGTWARCCLDRYSRLTQISLDLSRHTSAGGKKNSLQFLDQDGAGAWDGCSWVYEQHSHYSAIVTHFTNLIIMEGHY